MEKFITLFSIIATLLFFQPISTSYADTIDKQDTEKEVIIKLRNEEGKKDVLEQIEEINYQFETVPAFSVTVSEDSLDDLEKDPNIAYIEENISFTIADSAEKNRLPLIRSLTLNSYLWNITETNVPAAWNEGYSGEGVKVAVLDTGIFTHQYLYIAGGTSTVDYTNSWLDDHGHGTHVAGIIAAQPNPLNNVTGIAPNVQLYSVKVLDNHGYGSLEDVLEGIDWAIANDVDIINMSISTDGYSKLLEDLVNEAVGKGIIVVAATGNNGNESPVEYPAKFNNVVAVSSVDETLQLSSFSATGNEVDFVAPGEYIFSTYLNSYNTQKGTSQATPHVTGILALLKEKIPNGSKDVLIELLADNSIDFGPAGKDPYYGNGLVQYPVADEENNHSDEQEIPEQPNNEPEKAEQITYRGIALKEKTKVYKNQSIESEILKSYQQGTILKYKSLNDNWYEATVYINGEAHIGYISVNDVENITSPQVHLQGVALKDKTNVYSRASKSNSKVLKSYPKGTILKYKSLSSQWFEATVYINGKAFTGYIHVDDIETGNTAKAFEGFAIQNSTKVYSKATKSSPVLKSYPKGKVLRYTSFTSDWYQAVVYNNGKKFTGYIHKNDVINIDTDNQIQLRSIAVKNKVNVYKSTTKDSKVIKNYSKGSILKFKTYSKDWFEAIVYVNGKKHTGYIHISDVEIINPLQQALTGKAKWNKTNVYQKATKDSSILKSYPAGKSLRFKSFSKDWYEATVYVNGKNHTGYIHKNDIR